MSQLDDPKLLMRSIIQRIATGPELYRTEPARRLWPFLRDRRIEAYGDLARRFRD